MFDSSAEANTSAGAPWRICATSVDEASKSKVTLLAGCSRVKAVPISSNDSVSEAAANTVMLPSTVLASTAGDEPGAVPVAAAFAGDVVTVASAGDLVTVSEP